MQGIPQNDSGRIPGISGAEAVTLDGKLYFPKTTLGEWVKEYLTTAHIKYKTTDKIVASEPSHIKWIITLNTYQKRYIYKKQ